MVKKYKKGHKKTMGKINWKVVAWITVIVVVVGGIGWYMIASIPSKQQPAVPATYAPAGQLIPGFPQQLILDNNAAVTNSYVINYATTTNQYTAQWDSSSSMTALYTKYKQYLPQNGWTISNDVTRVATMRAVAAKNASGSVSVVITQNGSGSQVVLTYLIK